MNKDRYSNPYLIGALLGVVLLASFYTMGRGLGASSPLARITAVSLDTVASDHTRENAYLKRYFRPDRAVLNDWLVFLVLGAALGGLFSAAMANRIKGEIGRGPSITAVPRLLLAFGGGAFSGFAARLARGCTSGQALTGASELALGAWIFMLCIFAGAYATAYFFRKEWL